MDRSLEALVEAVAGIEEERALALVQSSLDSGVSPVEVLNACKRGVEVVGKKFEEGEYFLPELMMAGEIMTQISALVKTRFAAADSGEAPVGKAVLGTVKGDIHDIGKNIVSFLLGANGFEVVDLGVDVPPEKFVEAIEVHKPQVVGMSCLLTLAYDPMKDTVKAIADAGLRDKVKIMIGGAAVDEKIREYTGADAVGKDANDAVNLARKWAEGGK